MFYRAITWDWSLLCTTDTTDSGYSPFFLAYPVLFWFRAVD